MLIYSQNLLILMLKCGSLAMPFLAGPLRQPASSGVGIDIGQNAAYSFIGRMVVSVRIAANGFPMQRFLLTIFTPKAPIKKKHMSGITIALLQL